jgi:hypothetical protein
VVNDCLGTGETKMSIANDQQLKKFLSELSIVEQRQLSADFIESIIALNPDPLIARVIELAREDQTSQLEMEEAYRSIKSLAVNTYTACGADADWKAQAAHFVATAAKACLTPESQLDGKNTLAWKCAMQARMAKNCEMMESESDIVENEAQKQYQLADNFR